MTLYEHSTILYVCISIPPCLLSAVTVQPSVPAHVSATHQLPMHARLPLISDLYTLYILKASLYHSLECHCHLYHCNTGPSPIESRPQIGVCQTPMYLELHRPRQLRL